MFESLKQKLLLLILIVVMFMSCSKETPDQNHKLRSREFQGIPSLAISPEGRLWATWYAGITPGEDENNYVVVATSGDGDKTNILRIKQIVNYKHMKQFAFKMKLKPGFEAEYKKRHDDIWPELIEELSGSGVYDYSIFLDEETNFLFAFQKLKDGNTADLLSESRIVRKWWDYMSDIMDVNPDNSPVVSYLKEVFYLE